MYGGDNLTTRDKILHASIDLFAQKGFKEVSVREIAKTVGIKASSLYKHFQSKEDILHNIFALFKAQIAQTAIPKEELKRYVSTFSPEEYFRQSFAMFKAVMWSCPVTLKIAKIITLEQQRNQSVRQFFIEELIEKPNAILQYALDLMLENGSIDPVNTRVLAEEYNSYIIYLYFEQNFLQESPSLEVIEKKMAQHNDFYVHVVLKQKEGN